jgi:hypothetical protein
MTTRSLSLAVALTSLAACTPEFDPASEVTTLRVLAVRAEPPELAPAPALGDPPSSSGQAAPDTATLGALVAHPDFVADPARRVTLVHVACTPEAGDPTASACLSLTSLADPRALLPAADLALACADPGRGREGAITLAGLESCGRAGCEPIEVRLDSADPASAVALPSPAYRLPGDLGLGALPPGAPERILGIEVVTLALALDVAPDALAPAGTSTDACAALAAFGARFAEEWDLHANVASVKRIRVRGPDATDAPNTNPPLTGVAFDGTALPPPGGAPTAIAAVEADLLPLFPGDPDLLRERYTRRDAAGAAIEEKIEDWAFSWFATAGELEDLRTNAPDEPERFAPEPGRALVYVVARDLRGGTSWTIGEVDVSP